jgi:death on curing protein
MNYVTADDIVIIHDMIINKIGGTMGVCEPGLLVSLAEKPKTSFSGRELYPDIFYKAASLYEGLCNYHVFIDGNKRTAAIAMYRFLNINGYDLIATNKELVKYTLRITSDKLDITDIAIWISKQGVKVES